VFGASKPISIAREPAIQTFGDATREWDAEDPRDQSAAWQYGEQLFECRCTLPGAAAGPDQLQRFRVSVFGNPGESRMNARALRRHDFEQSRTIPLPQEAYGPLANPAITIVDDGISSSIECIERFHAEKVTSPEPATPGRRSGQQQPPQGQGSPSWQQPAVQHESLRFVSIGPLSQGNRTVDDSRLIPVVRYTARGTSST
jgi:hypothetical protein